jgi:hypothetical protein
MENNILVSIERLTRTDLMLNHDGWLKKIEFSPATIENNQIKVSGSIVYYKNGEIKSDKDYTQAFVAKYLEIYGENEEIPRSKNG